jgi:4-hydroxybenzoate polyprenyltransferase
LLFTLKAARPGFWLTSSWFYLLPLWPNVPWHSVAFWLGLIYVGLPLGMMLYAANDVTDRETDRLNPRKDSFLFGARPTEAQIRTLPARIFWIQIPFIIAFTCIIGPVALLWFAALAAGTTMYNLPRTGAKDHPGLDVLSQAGYLSVFVLADWVNGRPFYWPVFVFGALFAMHSHLFGQIMDREPDAAAGRRTTAVMIGERASKWIIVGMLLAEAAIATLIPAKPWLPVFLVGSALWFAMDVTFVWRNRAYAPWQMVLFFLGWNGLLLTETAYSVARNWGLVP